MKKVILMALIVTSSLTATAQDQVTDCKMRQWAKLVSVYIVNHDMKMFRYNDREGMQQVTFTEKELFGDAEINSVRDLSQALRTSIPFVTSLRNMDSAEPDFSALRGVKDNIIMMDIRRNIAHEDRSPYRIDEPFCSRSNGSTEVR
jgi:hypothetical protein